MESDKVVLDGGYVDLDPAKLASISTTAPASSVSDPLTLCNSDQVLFFWNLSGSLESLFQPTFIGCT